MSSRPSPFLYRLVSAAFACVLFTPLPAPAVVDVRGFVSAGGAQTDAASSWRSGHGFGVLDLGVDPQGNDAEEGRGDLQLVVDASKDVGGRTTLGAFLHVAARAEPESLGGEDAGLVEAYLEASWRLRDSDQLRLQIGQLLLPTSRENVSWAWSTPYTLTFSAINSWIAEEIRPTGLTLEYRAAATDLDLLRFGAAAFEGNDSAGTLLAWRGWGLTDRVSVRDEVVPLPPAASLSPDGGFGRQRDDGTLPIGEDLDDRVGYAGWLAWSRADASHGQLTYYDNRADRGLWRSGPGFEYAWHTRFWHAAADLQLGRWSLVSEWVSGETGMGFSDRRRVDIDFEAVYLLASVLTDPWLGGTWRFTARWDTFETEDTDLVGAFLQDDNDSEGDALTATIFWEWQQHPLRLGLEYLDVDSTRDQAVQQGFSPQVGGEQIRLELRYFFGR